MMEMEVVEIRHAHAKGRRAMRLGRAHSRALARSQIFEQTNVTMTDYLAQTINIRSFDGSVSIDMRECLCLLMVTPSSARIPTKKKTKTTTTTTTVAMAMREMINLTSTRRAGTWCNNNGLENIVFVQILCEANA